MDSSCNAFYSGSKNFMGDLKKVSKTMKLVKMKIVIMVMIVFLNKQKFIHIVQKEKNYRKKL